MNKNGRCGIDDFVISITKSAYRDADMNLCIDITFSKELSSSVDL